METGKPQDIQYFPVEIAIQKAGVVVRVEKPLPLLFENVAGVTVLNPGGKYGMGTLTLRIGGEEIFPEGFHAKTYMYHQSNHHEEEIVAKQVDEYLYRFTETAKGANIKANYTEPENGETGVLYLLFKLTR